MSVPFSLTRLLKFFVAGELLRRSIEFFKKADPEFQAVYLHVAEYNHQAIRLYTKHGFQCLSRCPVGDCPYSV